MGKEKKQDLTGRTERKKLIKNLSEFKIGSKIPGYKEYLEKMTRLDTLMEKYSVPGAFGTLETLDQKARDNMLKAMRETAEAGEEYLKNALAAKNVGDLADLKKGVPGVVNRLQGVLNRDQEALERYDPSVPMSLPQVMEEGRSNIVFLESDQMQKLGGAQNSRIPITFKGRRGEEHRGMFTKVTTAKDYDGVVNELLEKAANQCPNKAGQESIHNMLKTYRERNKERLGNASDAQIFQELFKTVVDKGEVRGVPQIRLKVKALEKKLGMDQRSLGVEGLKAIGEAFQAYDRETDNDLGLYMNGGMLGMKKGERIDNLNSAMSAVTKLLGAPGLIANSVNMKFVDKNGDALEGTFMDFSDGVDLAAGGETMKAVNDNPFDGETSWKGLRQMADLQVLDYICGNVDRHPGNLMYRTDEQGNIVGVQGIDNDSSFGSFAEKEENRHALPGADHLNVISSSMRKKVMGLTPAMLKFALRGRGLSEEKLDYAAKRLTTLQTAIREGDAYYKSHPTDKAYESGHLRTVPDKDFQKLKIHQLYGKGEINLFSLTHNRMQTAIDQYKGHRGYEFDPEAARELKQKELPEVAAVGRGFTGGNLLGALQGASRLVEDKDKKFKLDDLTSTFRGSSPQWDEMVAAAKKVAQMEKELLDNPQINIMTYNARREEINRAVAELEKKNDAYLDKKMDEKHVNNLDQLVGKNDYEKARIAHARKIREFTNAYKKPQELGKKDLEGLTEQDKVEIRIADELSSMQDQQQAVKLLREFHKKHGLAAPEKMKAEQDRLRGQTQEQGKGEARPEEGQVLGSS